jgi:hypothetical protein
MLQLVVGMLACYWEMTLQPPQLLHASTDLWFASPSDSSACSKLKQTITPTLDTEKN